MKIFILSALLAIATMAEAKAEDVWDTADGEVVRVSPAEIRGLPKAVVREMKRRECLIPQTYISSQTHNAILGSFQKKGTKDWAVLCSKKRVSSVLVFWGGSPDKVDEMSSSPDKNWLQGIDEKRIGFSRYIGRSEPRRISEYQARDGGSKPPSFSHDGIEESFLEKASTIHYYDKGVWTGISGAD